MIEKDIISALLKCVRMQGLISENTYQNSQKKLEYTARTFAAVTDTSYNGDIEKRKGV